MSNQGKLTVQALRWSIDDDTLMILDQRLLPDTIKYDNCRDAISVARAIADMRVRGAPAIGIAAAYAVYLSARRHYPADAGNWQQLVGKDMEILAESRPTAVNLFWAMNKMRDVLEAENSDPLKNLFDAACQIHQQDISANLTMGEIGAEILGDAKGVLTHCNAGALATGGYGTALGVIRSAHKRGLNQVFASETRPWRQGARLTLWELIEDGIPATLIADSAAAWLMQNGKIDWVIVGADRIAANGDVANKIGTYALAVLAKQHGVNFMVAAPMSTIDFDIESGQGITIEHRSPDELLGTMYSEADSMAKAWNPVFDVTPADFITAIVTERGAVMQPAKNSLWSLIE